jgi:hypothetical protein
MVPSTPAIRTVIGRGCGRTRRSTGTKAARFGTATPGFPLNLIEDAPPPMRASNFISGLEVMPVEIG